MVTRLIGILYLKSNLDSVKRMPYKYTSNSSQAPGGEIQCHFPSGRGVQRGLTVRWRAGGRAEPGRVGPDPLHMHWDRDWDERLIPALWQRRVDYVRPPGSWTTELFYFENLQR